jgi:hypothetical protein
MKYHYQFSRFSFLTSAFTAVTCLAMCASANAQDSKTSAGEKLFDSPEDAVKALQSAAKSEDKSALNQIFGPGLHELRTGDAVQDSNNFQGFSAAVQEKCEAEPETNNMITLDIGEKGWPFAIPLAKQGNQWFFDTAAGKEEIINRHIGRDELNAIGVCHAYVKAQQEYFNDDTDGSGGKKYALKFKSTPGKKDGLFWRATNGETSPFGDLIAEAHEEGYHHHKSGKHPFHGYYFKILTKQGADAPGGKMNYKADGKLTGGFAMVAYPENWNQSGVMTFIVNQEGKVYQANLGEKTKAIASDMTEYNPGGDWTVTEDKGVTEWSTDR